MVNEDCWRNPNGLPKKKGIVGYMLFRSFQVQYNNWTLPWRDPFPMGIEEVTL